MRRPRFGYLLVLLVLVPIAGAQTTTAERPSLTLDPVSRDAAPGSTFNVTAIFGDPLDTPITWSLSYAAEPGIKLSYARWEVTVAPGTRENVNATITLNHATNTSHAITFLAQETQASATAAGRTTKLELREQLQVRVGAPPPPSASAPQVTLLMEPSPIVIPRGGNATARLLIVNHGAAMDAPLIEFKNAPGVEAHVVSAPATIASGERAAVELRFVHIGAEAVGAKVPGGLAIRAARATLGFPIEIGAPLHPPAPATDLSEAAALDAALSGAAYDERVLVAAALASVGAGWSALWLSRHKWLPLLAALYTRLRPSRMLDHPLRKRIVELVQREPGITFSELARRLDIAPGQLTHHARMLEKAGIVFSSPDGQTRRFFHVAHGRLDAVPSLAERTLAALRRQPMRASDLAKELAVSRQSLHYHVKQLIAEGKLVARSDGLLEAAAAPAGSSPAASLARS